MSRLIKDYTLPLEIKDYWQNGGDYSDNMGTVSKAKYYDILQVAGYKLQQYINGEWLDSDMIFNRSDRIYRIKP